MSDFAGIVKLQVETLLGELRRQQEKRCRELTQTANLQAKELLRGGRKQLHERGRQALSSERTRRNAALQKARNRIRAQDSQRVQLLYAELLRQAWPQVQEQLQQRWSAETNRKEWCEKLLDEAHGTLAPTTWTIEHPEDWPDREAFWLAGEIETRGLPKATLHGTPELRAGLKISCGSACIDGSINGLLSRRRRVQARLLAAWEQQSQQIEGGRDD